MKKLITFLGSMQFAVINLSLLFIVTVLGTMAQVKLGIYHATELYFGSLFIFWNILGLNIPVLPGGFLIGILMTLNLIIAHQKRIVFSRKKIGIWLIHIGVVLLLLGAGLTHLMAIETQLKFQEGEKKNFTSYPREVELVFIETLKNGNDKVISFSQNDLLSKSKLTHPELAFTLIIQDALLNSELYFDNNLSKATKGFGKEIYTRTRKKETEDNKRNISSAYVTVLDQKNQPLGTWLLSSAFKYTQYIDPAQRYRLEIRQKRSYTPFYMTLNKFTHKRYPGTDIPHHYESDVTITYPDNDSEFSDKIYMNHPLRYEGKTYYQASFSQSKNVTTSILQVVENPSWLMPYISCLIISIGLLIHFGIALLSFLHKPRKKDVS